jgi:hypothetical protein
MLSLYYQTEPDRGVQIPNCTPFCLRNRDSVYATKNVYIRSMIENLLDQPVNKIHKNTYNWPARTADHRASPRRSALRSPLRRGCGLLAARQTV